MKTLHCLDGTTNKLTLCGQERSVGLVASPKSFLELTDGEIDNLTVCTDCAAKRAEIAVLAGEGAGV